ncbi:glutamine-dependent NAD(+) synthetase [Toensbergia leucococca]|nr:glutamine-dependent NAD(+) synthetase [Toensbergia leucococca]
MAPLVNLAVCSLNQWVLDWEENAGRIIRAVQLAKDKGASLLVTPELSISSYGALDHHLGIDGNYREMRYFTPWQKTRVVEEYELEDVVARITGQSKVPFGDAVLDFKGIRLAPESCEELFTAAAPHISYALGAGVEIFTNSSGSHHELRKLKTRMDLIIEATRKCGGVYLYSNQKGCDGDRLYYDGSSLIVVNGSVIAIGAQFSLDDVEVLTATVDLEHVRSFRCSPSRGLQAQQTPGFQCIDTDVQLSQAQGNQIPRAGASEETEVSYHSPEEEITLGPACWLWDYLRRSGAAGYFVPLSGGIDSCATATIVYSMCVLVVEAIQKNKKQVIEDARRIVGEDSKSDWKPSSAQDLCHRIFHCCFMGTTNSGKDTRARARGLAEQIGAFHIDVNIDSAVSGILKVFSLWANFTPRFASDGGTSAENLALQNIQARGRMVIAYLFAQLLPTFRSRQGGGSLLVLGSANVDESLRGYMTKYDCSSADINPIGGISKTDLKRFIAYAQHKLDLPILGDFLTAIPTAELIPIVGGKVQSDEEEMGLTYDELSTFGRLRKIAKLGPWGVYSTLLHRWIDRTPRQIYEKTRTFFYYYAINRHKMTVLTPSLHLESYGPDDNRFDLRPFLYPRFSWPFKKIDAHVESLEAQSKGATTDK